METCIYEGFVTHRRFKPQRHYFSYKTFSILFDLSELEDLHKKIGIFSFNRFNIFSFYNKDHGSRDGNDLSSTCVTYWLNNLQNLGIKENYYLTLNPIHDVKSEKIIKRVNFTHPYLNSKTSKLQKDLYKLQGKKRTWFCGSYFGYGFHEDGLKSSLEMLKYFKT